MPAHRLLPSIPELTKLVEAGYTHSEIAEYVFQTTGERVSRSAVSSALSRAGVSREGPRYKDELPWRVATKHLTQYPARMLRLLGRKHAGLPLNDDENGRLLAWLDALAEHEAVVAYCPDGPGFLYVSADEVGDGTDGIPIRRRTITLDELT